jgi:subtilisin family serine protease
MAAPHVAGLAALAISADPPLADHIDRLELIITRMSIPKTSGETCGGISGTQVPNNTYGYGRIDVLGSVILAINPKIFLPLFAPAWSPTSDQENG